MTLLPRTPAAATACACGEKIGFSKPSQAAAIYLDTGATLDDLREAVKTLEEIERAARRVLGGVHPTAAGIGKNLQAARAALRAREESDVCGAMAAMAPPSAQH